MIFEKLFMLNDKKISSRNFLFSIKTGHEKINQLSVLFIFQNVLFTMQI